MKNTTGRRNLVVCVSGVTLLVCGLAFEALSSQVKGPHPFGELPSESAKTGPQIRVETDLALANVIVTDPNDRFVTGLEQNNFRVFENGIEQEIVNVSVEDAPISIGLVMDLSGSMSDKLDKARQAAIAFFHTANVNDEFFLVTFGDSARLITPFTSSVEELQDSLLFTAAKGRTALL